MATYLMLGKYSPDALDGISAVRTEKAIEHINSNNGKLMSMYVLVVDYDLVLIVDFPGVKEAMQTSLALTRLTGISFATSEAVSVKDFDKLVL